MARRKKRTPNAHQSDTIQLLAELESAYRGLQQAAQTYYRLRTPKCDNIVPKVNDLMLGIQDIQKEVATALPIVMGE